MASPQSSGSSSSSSSSTSGEKTNALTASPTSRPRTTIILGVREYNNNSNNNINSSMLASNPTTTNALSTNSAPTLPTTSGTSSNPGTPPASAPASSCSVNNILSNSSSALPTATVTLEGYLSKQDEKAIIKGWKKRWFSANDIDFKMFYYKSSFTSRDVYDQVAGNIDLTEVSEIKTSSSNKYGFDLTTPNRVWYLVANNEEEQNYWVSGLSQILKRCKRFSSKETERKSNSQMAIASSTTPRADSKHASQDMMSKLDSDSASGQSSTAPTTPTTTPAKKAAQEASRLSIPGAYVEGYLQKQGEKGLVKSWKKRYFVAKGSKMWYYKQTLSSSGYDQRAGFIDLTSVTKLEQLTGAKEKNQFLIHTPARTWYLMGSNEEDVQNWLCALTTLIASVSQQPTSTDSIRSSLFNRSTSDTTWMKSASSQNKMDGEYQRMLQRLNELEKMLQDRDKTIEGLKEKIVKMEDKMVLWNRIAFLNWAEATDLEKRLKESEKASKDPDDEPYLKQIRLLKRQLNEKTFNCQVLESEVERLNGELKKTKASSSSSSPTLPPLQEQ
eukprot:TRINITY_DN362_c3_g5_i1.p1 TRINITY_DN362_c3_g5~~TRINITY_DN362_c3_g5_i1.p1  ORF type:complete len:557 (-),score=160.28 TRINITY_DN362_c3_g5_i1:134-1804(-)